MKLPVDGQPVHTRSLTIVLSQRADGRLRAFGQVIDLRKTGFVPMPYELSTAGIIHLMSLDAVVDPATRRLEELEVAQPAVAVEASEVTRGESCRDPASTLQQLLGCRFDSELPAELGRSFGGPRGCSHLLTLFHLMASALPRALDMDETIQRERPGSREPGDKLFRRSVFVDGHQPEDGVLHLAVQLSDFHEAPRSTAAQRIDLLARQTEVRVLADVSLAGLTMREIHAYERDRTRAGFGDAEWRDRGEWVAPLVGRPVMPGLGRALRDEFGGREDARLLLDALLQLAPGFVQCTPVLADTLLSQAISELDRGGERRAAAPSFLAHGGAADSCYMWRSEGPLLQIRPGSSGAGDATPV